MGAKDRHGGPDMGVKVFWWLWRTWDKCEGPDIDLKGFSWAWRA